MEHYPAVGSCKTGVTEKKIGCPADRQRLYDRVGKKISWSMLLLPISFAVSDRICAFGVIWRSCWLR